MDRFSDKLAFVLHWSSRRQKTTLLQEAGPNRTEAGAILDLSTYACNNRRYPRFSVCLTAHPTVVSGISGPSFHEGYSCQSALYETTFGCYQITPRPHGSEIFQSKTWHNCGPIYDIARVTDRYSIFKKEPAYHLISRV